MEAMKLTVEGEDVLLTPENNVAVIETDGADLNAATSVFGAVVESILENSQVEIYIDDKEIAHHIEGISYFPAFKMKECIQSKSNLVYINLHYKADLIELAKKSNIYLIAIKCPVQETDSPVPTDYEDDSIFYIDNDNESLNRKLDTADGYAAFIRLYIEWMEKEAEEQVAIVEDGVRWAKNIKMRYGNSVNPQIYYFGKKGSSLYGEEFEGYVNESWISFSEQCSDVEKFADYLQKDLEKSHTAFQEMRDNFFKKLFREWNSMIDKSEDMSSAAQALQDDLEKKKAEFEAEVEKFYSSDRALRNLFRKYANNMMGRLITQMKHIKEVDDWENSMKDTVDFEQSVVQSDAVKRAIAQMSDRDREILDLIGRGRPQKEIAKKLNLSDSAISQRIKKIKAVLLTV